MNRKRRTKIFIDYGRYQAIELAGLIEDMEEIEFIQEPMEGLTMIKVRESAENSLFFLGEVLVTETKVRIKDQLGIGLVKGNDPELSRALAILDAGFELGLEIIDEWIPIFEECEQKGLAALQEKRDVIARTKVEFETMDV